jgi:hypothetical protein
MSGLGMFETTNGIKIVPVKRHRQFDRITANEICKQAGLNPKF